MEISNATRFDLDRCILEFDRAVRILYGEPVARRPSPAEAVAEENLRDEVRRDAAFLPDADGALDAGTAAWGRASLFAFPFAFPGRATLARGGPLEPEPGADENTLAYSKYAAAAVSATRNATFFLSAPSFMICRPQSGGQRCPA